MINTSVAHSRKRLPNEVVADFPEIQDEAQGTVESGPGGRRAVAKVGVTALLSLVALTGASAVLFTTPVESEAASKTEQRSGGAGWGDKGGGVKINPGGGWGDRGKTTTTTPKLDFGKKADPTPAPKMDWGKKADPTPAPKFNFEKKADPSPAIKWGDKKEDKKPGMVLPGPLHKEEKKQEGIQWGEKRETVPPPVTQQREGIQWGERQEKKEVGKAPGGGIILPGQGSETKTDTTKKPAVKWGDRKDGQGSTQGPISTQQPIPQEGWQTGRQVRIPQERIHRIDPQPAQRERVVIIKERHYYHDSGWRITYGDAFFEGFIWGTLMSSSHNYHTHPVYVVSPVTGQPIGNVQPPAGQDRFENEMQAQLAILNIMAQEQKGADGNFDPSTGLFEPNKDDPKELGDRLSAAASYNMLKRGETVYFHSAGGSNEKLTGLDDLKVYLYTKGDQTAAAHATQAVQPAVVKQQESHTARNIAIALALTAVAGGAIAGGIYLARRRQDS